MCFFNWCCYDQYCGIYQVFLTGQAQYLPNMYRARYRLLLLLWESIHDMIALDIPLVWAFSDEIYP